MLHMREERFSRICSHFPATFLSPLVAYHRIDPTLFHLFEEAVRYYNERSKEYDYINRTPNGILVPKREIEEEYNTVVCTFLNILKSLHIDACVVRWDFPIVRCKTKDVTNEHMKRSYASEHPHSDCWIGWDSASLLLLMPLLGDTENNWVQFFALPNSFNESWTKRLPTFAEGGVMAQQCTPLPKHYEKGCLYLADMAVVHATRREEGASWRISASTTIALEEPISGSFGSNTQFTTEEMYKIGTGMKVACLSNMGEIISTTATNQPIDVRLVKM